MSNVIQLFPKESYEILYSFEDDDKTVKAITHPLWSFAIVKNKDRRALVCKSTNEVFGELPKDQFNMMLLQWLLIDDPLILEL